MFDKSVNGLVSLAVGSCFESNDAAKIKKCISRYTHETGASGQLKKIIYNMKEAILGLFGRSDRQIAQRVITNRVFSVLPIGLFVSKQKFDKLSDKALSIGVFVNGNTPDISEETYRNMYYAAKMIHLFLYQNDNGSNLLVPYNPNRAQTAKSQSRGQSSDYQIFGLSPGAALNDVKSAYTKIVKTCHPDKVIRGVEESLEAFNSRKEQLQRKFQAAKEAFDRIRNAA